MKYIIIGIIVVLLSFIVNVKAQDIIGKTFKKNVMCSTHEFVTNDLQKKHKQIRVWWAVTSDDELIELFVNNIKGTWIIILSNPEGITCGLIGGEQSGSNFNIDNSSLDDRI